MAGNPCFTCGNKVPAALQQMGAWVPLLRKMHSSEVLLKSTRFLMLPVAPHAARLEFFLRLFREHKPLMRQLFVLLFDQIGPAVGNLLAFGRPESVFLRFGVMALGLGATAQNKADPIRATNIAFFL